MRHISHTDSPPTDAHAVVGERGHRERGGDTARTAPKVRECTFCEIETFSHTKLDHRTGDFVVLKKIYLGVSIDFTSVERSKQFFISGSTSVLKLPFDYIHSKRNSGLFGSLNMKHWKIDRSFVNLTNSTLKSNEFFKEAWALRDPMPRILVDLSVMNNKEKSFWLNNLMIWMLEYKTELNLKLGIQWPRQ